MTPERVAEKVNAFIGELFTGLDADAMTVLAQTYLKHILLIEEIREVGR